MKSDSEVLADHYQNTFDLARYMWEARNTAFLYLLGVVGLAALLALPVPEAQPLMLDWVAKLLGANEARREALKTSFPYGVLQTILLMVILYLMIILYHRTATIQRLYKYLDVLESELRKKLNLPSDSFVFAREGRFYHQHKPVHGQYVAYGFFGMLGFMLVTFLGYRVWTDFVNGQVFVGLINFVLSAATLFFFWAYIAASFGKEGAKDASDTAPESTE